MPAKRGLGRGLDALIPTSEVNTPAGLTLAPVEAITRNPRQPRAQMDPAALEDLAASIREHGVIQPLIVAQGSFPGRYTLIAGERRLEASKLAGLTQVPVVVREASEQQLLELALIENIQRADLGPYETALAYKHLVEDFNLSHEAVAQRVGKKRATVSNTLRLLKLPAPVMEALIDGRLSEGHARALLQLPSPQAQSAACQTVLTKDLTVRQTEELVRQLLGHKPERPPRVRHLESEALAARLRDRLGTRVRLNRDQKTGVGSIVIHYFSEEELNAIAGVILGEKGNS